MSLKPQDFTLSPATTDNYASNVASPKTGSLTHTGDQRNEQQVEEIKLDAPRPADEMTLEVTVVKPRKQKNKISVDKLSDLDASTSSAKRKLACLIVPKEFEADNQEITTYELGKKAVEIECPTF
jgi:hypothetical protein